MFNDVCILLFTISACGIISKGQAEGTYTRDKQEDFQEFKKKVKHVLDPLQNVDENKNDMYRYTLTGRTFGLRRLKMAIPAIMYKLGVMTTMLGFLTLIAIKGLLVGVALLVLQLSKLLAQFHTLKSGYSEVNHKQPQNIHVHVHGSSPGHYTYTHSDHGPYSDWSRSESALFSKLDDRYSANKELKDWQDSLYLQEI